MNIWLTFFLAGMLTFGMRFSFVWLLGRFEVPARMRRALHFVPPAVFSAIALPSLVLSDGHLSLGLDNYRLLAGLTAVAVAFYSRNSLATILAGMLVLILLQVFGG